MSDLLKDYRKLKGKKEWEESLKKVLKRSSVINLLKEEALDMVDKCDFSKVTYNRLALAACLVYVASLCRGGLMKQKELCEMFGITEITFRKYWKKVAKHWVETVEDNPKEKLIEIYKRVQNAIFITEESFM
ncbi:MAG: hypothetical protein ACOC5T_08020 [Elusimicrobiota bacterium]